MAESDGVPNTKFVFDKLPDGVKFVRTMPGGKGTVMVECRHPEPFRMTTLHNKPICVLCKGWDFSRTCLTVVEVSWKGDKPPSGTPMADQAVVAESQQASLF